MCGYPLKPRCDGFHGELLTDNPDGDAGWDWRLFVRATFEMRDVSQSQEFSASRQWLNRVQVSACDHYREAGLGSQQPWRPRPMISRRFHTFWSGSPSNVTRAPEANS